MRRSWIMARFLIRDLFHSLAGVVPLAAALAFGIIAFEYGMDQAQFVIVAGIGIGTICLLTTLLLASRVNRASSYPLLARLHRRAELLMALVLSGLVITIVLATLITAANLFTGRLTLDFPSALWIVPTWLILWLLAATLALPLSALVSRGGSHLAGYVVLTALLLANDRKAMLATRGWDWLARVVTFILWPVSTLLSRASDGIHDQSYWLSLALTLAYANLLFLLATRLLEDKDLLWTE
ncbi:hypothetical protein ACFLYD_05240 [Chloroflexota bacterium]